MPSQREESAQSLLETCFFGGLNESYGANLSKEKDAKGKTYWSVTFAKNGILDGVIKVYSPNFILVSWQGKYGRGRERCSTESEAREILQRFINR